MALNSHLTKCFFYACSLTSQASKQVTTKNTIASDIKKNNVWKKERLNEKLYKWITTTNVSSRL